MNNIAIKKRVQQMSYDHFNISLYCRIYELNEITDFEEFDKKFRRKFKDVKIGRVYLECFRGMMWVEKEQILRAKNYFEGLGIATSGGITTGEEPGREGFESMCFSSERDVEAIREAVRLNAEIFDEFILDDFFFTNCRCPKCIEKKGNRSWSEFRMEQMRWMAEEVVLKTAKEVNPDINVIIKFPQWYEYYRETGYDLTTEPKMFDSIYTGTETRNPEYSQQHMPKYTSYFIMRYLESAAPGRNLGGWIDQYDGTYNMSSYLEQAYITLFSKPKELNLFCLGTLMNEPEYSPFVPAMGQALADVDSYLGKLGNPVGVATYLPGYGRGEMYLHNYLGMCGIPLDPQIEYPEDAKSLFMTEGAAADPQIVSRIKKSLLNGANIMVTSGFVRKMGEAFTELVNVKYSAAKALVSDYAVTKDNGISVSGKYRGTKEILIPQMDYCTNDIWELAGAFGTDYNFPILLRTRYGNGRISVLTVPDNMGDMYHYPPQILGAVREQLMAELPVRVEGPAKVQMFLYDNNCMILRSDLEYYETVTLHLDEKITAVKDLIKGEMISVTDHKVTFQLMPFVNYVLEFCEK